MAHRLAATVILGLLLSGQSYADDAAERLSSYNIDESAISVSGISSGAYMAVQYHVAHSARVMGAGVVAGGPYYCAQDSVATALTTCMGGVPQPSASTLELVTNALANSGDVDDTTHLRGDRVYLFSGTHDEVVATVVMESLRTYYEAYIDADDIVFIDTVDAPHAFITDSDTSQACFPSCPQMMDCLNVCIAAAGDCPPTNPCLADNHCTYVNNCGYDTANAILTQIYGTLRDHDEPDRNRIVAFRQDEFVETPSAISMGDTGYLYVPAACESGDTACRLHVAFHGCLQGADRIGDAFYWGAGYNRWAEANDIIVLYPQAIGSSNVALYNPLSCWDWWGYTGPFYPRKDGHQVRTVNAMVDRLIGDQ